MVRYNVWEVFFAGQLLKLCIFEYLLYTSFYFCFIFFFLFYSFFDIDRLLRYLANVFLHVVCFKMILLISYIYAFVLTKFIRMSLIQSYLSLSFPPE